MPQLTDFFLQTAILLRRKSARKAEIRLRRGTPPWRLLPCRTLCLSKQKHRARSANCVQAQPGRGEETRTPDILLPKQARYQLRYTSIKSQRFQTAFYCNGFPPRSQGNPAEFRGFPERNCRMGRGIRSTAQIPNRETEAPAYRHAANTGANNGDTNHHTAHRNSAKIPKRETAKPHPHSWQSDGKEVPFFYTKTPFSYLPRDRNML